MAQTFAGVVVEIDLGGLGLGGGEGSGIDRKAVVLRGDADLAGGEVFHGLVAAAMAELQFEGLSAEGVAEDLVAETDAEDRLLADERLDGFVRVGNDAGIAGAVGEEDAVGIRCERFVRRGRGRKDADAETVLAEAAQDVGLEAEIERDDAMLDGRERGEIIFAGEGRRAGGALALDEGPLAAELVLGIPIVGGLAGDFLDEIALEIGPLFGEVNGGGVGKFFGGHHAAQGALGAQAESERAGIDTGEAGDVVALEIGVERLDATPVADDGGELADDEAGDVGLVRFDVEEVDPRVADERIGHRDDLALVGGVGQDFLVTGHGGVETDFAIDGEGRAEREAAPDGAVFEGEKGGIHGAPISRVKREAQEIVR